MKAKEFVSEFMDGVLEGNPLKREFGLFAVSEDRFLLEDREKVRLRLLPGAELAERFRSNGAPEAGSRMEAMIGEINRRKGDGEQIRQALSLYNNLVIECRADDAKDMAVVAISLEYGWPGRAGTLFMGEAACAPSEFDGLDRGDIEALMLAAMEKAFPDFSPETGMSLKNC